MKAELILIANAAIARLFSHDPVDGSWRTIATLEHPSSRRKASELGGSRAGHGSADSRPGGVAFEPRLDAKHKQQLHFADELAQRVEEELAAGRFDHFVLLASSPFLGEFKQRLGPHAAKALRTAVDSDLTSFPPDEVRRRVDTVLHPLRSRT